MMTIAYVSTRGGTKPMNFLQVAMEGLAPDGGLFVPTIVPRLGNVSGMSYFQVAFEVFKLLAPDIPPNILWRLCKDVYTPEKFANTMDGDDAKDIVPLRKLGNDNRYLLRLSNGPTGAFKDIALQFLGAVFEYQLSKTGEELNILGATSGDTGSAAIEAMLGRKGIKVFMLSPESNMSKFQEAQMWGVENPNVFNLTVPTFDDGQKLVKEVSADLDFKNKHNIGTINSINWVRVAAQVVYYVWAGMKVNNLRGPFDVMVPTGNFGNICAAYIAKMMGIPIRKFVLVTNENDVLKRFFQTGIYEPPKGMVSTTSPSMDITNASNFERFVYYLLGNDSARVKSLWDELNTTGRFDLSAEMLRIKATGFWATSITSSRSSNTIKWVYDNYGIVIDPHTAVAMSAALDLAQPNVPCVIAETAQPCKFDETVEAALGRKAQRPPAFAGMEDRPVSRTSIVPTAQAVKEFITANT
jgi:threonine synthase